MGTCEKFLFPLILCVGSVLRIGLMLYGRWQDQNMAVKYTDIDYHVFTDAAEYVTKGESPYLRPTYRYTPILAWILTPNITLFMEFGKILFIASDVLVGYLLYVILRKRSCSEMTAAICASFWLLNPLPATVSSRGNAESIIAVLVLATLYFIMKQGTFNLCIAGLIYGLSVHMKIYPVTYSLPIYLMLDGHYHKEKKIRTLFGCDILPNKHRLIFVFCSAVSFILLTSLCYLWYEWEFIEETYLYHVTRRDIKHNFSIYFYMLYLTAETSYSWVIGLIAFVPQASLLVLSSWYFSRDLPFCCFINTFVFVTFNKVCTSQYFLWYLSILPLVIPSLDLTIKESIVMVVAWFAGQGLWLAPAYYLEFEGKDTYFLIWLASIVFFVINCSILWRIGRRYKRTPLFYNGKLVPMKTNFTSHKGTRNIKRRPLRNDAKKTK